MLNNIMLVLVVCLWTNLILNTGTFMSCGHANVSALLPWYGMVSMLHSEHEIHKSNLNEYQQQQ